MEWQGGSCQAPLWRYQHLGVIQLALRIQTQPSILHLTDYNFPCRFALARARSRYWSSLGWPTSRFAGCLLHAKPICSPSLLFSSSFFVMAIKPWILEETGIIFQHAPLLVAQTLEFISPNFHVSCYVLSAWVEVSSILVIGIQSHRFLEAL